MLGQRCRPMEAKNTYGTGCFLLLHTGAEAVASQAGLLTTMVPVLAQCMRSPCTDCLTSGDAQKNSPCLCWNQRTCTDQGTHTAHAPAFPDRCWSADAASAVKGTSTEEERPVHAGIPAGA